MKLLAKWKRAFYPEPEFLLTPVWQESVEAFRQYRTRPGPKRLFNVINRLTSHKPLWQSNGNQIDQNRAEAPPQFWNFESALIERSLRRASIAFEIIRSITDPDARSTVRMVLAARSLLAHNDLELADALLSEPRSRDEWPELALEDWFLFRLRCRVSHPSNTELFSRLIETRSPHLKGIAAEWCRHRWRFEGPSAALFDEMLQVADVIGKRDNLDTECLALAFRIGRPDLADLLLGKRPSLSSYYTRVLPLASHLLSQKATNSASTHQTGILDYAQIHDYFLTQSQALTEELADPEKSLAIIGNSPCEEGKSKGEAIDAHDIIVRFNHFSTEPEYAPDYGKRYTIHARSPNAEPELDRRSKPAAITVFPRGDFLHLTRNWDHVMQLHRAGIRMACLPTGSSHDLWQTLLAEPSLGLTMCVYVKSARGFLPRESCFGFSFVDQIDPASTKARYFSDDPVSLTHRWREERQIFDQLLS